MKFLIAGAGAIGGYIGARMALAGEDVTLFARGAHLAAMQRDGLRVISPEGDFEARPRVIGDLADAGAVDVIFLAVKAHSLTQLAPQIKPLLSETTTVVSTQNGIPWWYFQFNEPHVRLECVDPGGVIADSIPSRHVLGSIVYFSTEISEPGVIRHTEGNRISIGEPDGSRSERCRVIADALISSGLRCPATTRLSHETWVKLLGNVSFNPISALTRATLAQMVRDPGVCGLIREMMAEVEKLANKLGIQLAVSIEQRIAGAEKVGEHKTSMLQDLEAGRTLELEAMVGSVLELAARLEIPMPQTASIYACTALLDTIARGRK